MACHGVMHRGTCAIFGGCARFVGHGMGIDMVSRAHCVIKHCGLHIDTYTLADGTEVNKLRSEAGSE